MFETGARLSDGIEHTIFGGALAAFDPNRTLRLGFGNGPEGWKADLGGDGKNVNDFRARE
jgi:hypothetical protein